MLYGATFSLFAVFNWIFFLASVYCFWLDWYLNPNRAKIFQGQAFQGGSRQNSGGGQFRKQPQGDVTPEQKAKRIVGITVGSIVVFVFFFIFIDLISDDDYDDSQTTVENESGNLNSQDAPDVPGQFVDKGNDLFNKGDYDSADFYYDRALSSNSQYMAAVYGKGIVLWQRGRKDEATAYFVRSYEGGYRYAWLSWVLGDMHDKRDEKAKAITYYKEAIQLDSAFHDVYERLAQLEPKNAEKYKALAEKWKD